MTTSKQAAPVADIAEDEDGWQALDEIEGGSMSRKDKGKGKDDRPSWLPDGMEPILEELPKWNLLAEVLREAEEEIIRQESLRKSITGNHHASCIYENHSSLFFISLRNPRKQHHPCHGLFNADLQRRYGVPFRNGPRRPQRFQRPQNDDAEAPALLVAEVTARRAEAGRPHALCVPAGRGAR